MYILGWQSRRKEEISGIFSQYLSNVLGTMLSISMKETLKLIKRSNGINGSYNKHDSNNGNSCIDNVVLIVERVIKDYDYIIDTFLKYWEYFVCYKLNNNKYIYTNNISNIDNNYAIKWIGDDIEQFFEQSPKHVVQNQHDGLMFFISSRGDLDKVTCDSECELYEDSETIEKLVIKTPQIVENVSFNAAEVFASCEPCTFDVGEASDLNREISKKLISRNSADVHGGHGQDAFRLRAHRRDLCCPKGLILQSRSLKDAGNTNLSNTDLATNTDDSQIHQINKITVCSECEYHFVHTWNITDDFEPSKEDLWHTIKNENICDRFGTLVIKITNEQTLGKMNQFLFPILNHTHLSEIKPNPNDEGSDNVNNNNNNDNNNSNNTTNSNSSTGSNTPRLKQISLTTIQARSKSISAISDEKEMGAIGNANGNKK